MKNFCPPYTPQLAAVNRPMWALRKFKGDSTYRPWCFREIWSPIRLGLVWKEGIRMNRVLNPTPTIMAFTEVTNAHGPSPQHSGLHRAVRQLQQEVTGPRQGLNLPCPRSKGWMGEQIRCQNFLVKRLQSRYTHPVIKCTLGSICKTS